LLSDTPVVIDASTLINLAASEKLVELLSCLSAVRSICTIVKNECLYLRSSDGTKIESISPSHWITDGLLSECQLQADEEERFVVFAAQIDDGEAMSLAIAEGRACALATDDRKACRIATAANIKTISTLQIVQEWSKDKEPLDIAKVLSAIERRARFRPPTDDPQFKWWADSLNLAP
jgi:predicted nucleic acid-binding protein